MILAVILIAWILLSFVVLLMVAGAASKKKPVLKPVGGSFAEFEAAVQPTDRDRREEVGGELAAIDLHHPTLDVQH